MGDVVQINNNKVNYETVLFQHAYSWRLNNNTWIYLYNYLFINITHFDKYILDTKNCNTRLQEKRGG